MIDQAFIVNKGKYTGHSVQVYRSKYVLLYDFLKLCVYKMNQTSLYKYKALPGVKERYAFLHSTPNNLKLTEKLI